jgi:acetyl esterase/lipase
MKFMILPMALLFFLTGCVAARDFDSITHLRNLEYANIDHHSLKLDLSIPGGEGPYPLIIWIHGGAWRGGTRHISPEHSARQQLKRGYAVASIDYRLSQQALFPAQIHDCKAAIRWLRGNAKTYRLDPSRFVVWGASAGGHLSTLLGTSGEVAELEDRSMGYSQVSSRVQGVVNWYGPTDFLKMGGKHNRETSPESLLIGCPIQDCPNQVAKANPINYISADDPPFFIQHGTMDKAVPFNQSKLLYTALRNARIPTSFVPLEGAGHSDPRFSHANNVALIETFIDGIMLRSTRVDNN